MPHDVVSLRQLRAQAYASMEAANASDTDDRQEKFDAAAAEVETYDREIANADRLQKLRGASALPALPVDGGQAAQGFMAKYLDLPPEAHIIRPGQTMSVAQGRAFGDLLIAARRAALGRGVDDRLIEASLGANEAVPSDGGFLVESPIQTGLLRRTFEVSNIASKVRHIPIGDNANGTKINALKDNSRATGSRWGGVQGYWIGEGDSLTPSRPKFRQMSLELKKLAGLIYATSELLQDSTALVAVINEAFPMEFAFMADDAIFEGTGAAMPLGFMNAASKVTVSKETGQGARTIQKENIDKMMARMLPGSISKSEWWINQDAMPALQSMTMVIGTGGVPVYLQPGGLSASPFGTLLGRPVIPVEYCSTLGTEGDIVLVDPSQYVMIDKGSIQYATSIHVAFLTDEQAFRFIWRVDGQPVDDLPVTPFKGTATLSAFVTLATRA